MSSVKSNIILNGVNTITGILFPVATFPYAARILLPDGIGAVNFLNSVIGYIVLLTSLGIPMYAVREVAKYRDDKAARDKITVEILVLSTFLCLLGYVAVWLLAEFVPQIHSQAPLFYVLSLTIVFTTIGVNWFYQGIEDFKFITIRAVIIRTLCAAALFIFVKNSSDLLLYGIITVGSTVGNNFINFVHLRKHVDYGLIRFSNLNISRHIKPSLQVFALNLIISLYIQLNSIMLGFMAGEEQVGYFAAGTKIGHIGLTAVSSLCTVLLPRCTNIIKNGDKEAFRTLIGKSLSLTIGLSLPMAAGLMILAVPVISIFCGSEFDASVPVLLLNAPVIIFINMSNLVVLQILYPMDKIRIIITSISLGAITNFVFNLILIPELGATGAAAATFLAEFIVILSLLLRGRAFYPFTLRNLIDTNKIIATVIMGLGVWGFIKIVSCSYIELFGGSLLGMALFFLSLLCMKDPLALEIITLIRRKK